MLRDRRNDGNMNLGITSVEQGVESTAPRCNVAKRGQQNQAGQANQASQHTSANSHGGDLATRNDTLDEENEGDHLKETKNTWILVSFELMADIRVYIPSAGMCSLV